MSGNESRRLASAKYNWEISPFKHTLKALSYEIFSVFIWIFINHSAYQRKASWGDVCGCCADIISAFPWNQIFWNIFHFRKIEKLGQTLLLMWHSWWIPFQQEKWKKTRNPHLLLLVLSIIHCINSLLIFHFHAFGTKMWVVQASTVHKCVPNKVY